MNEAIEDQAHGIGGLGRAHLRRRYMILFYSLLLTMVAVPALGALGIDPGFIELFLAANLLIAVVPLGTKRAQRVLLFVLMILWAVRLATIWLHDPALSMITLGMWTIVGLLAAASALKFAMNARLVDTEHLYAALSAYLLAGIFLGLFYWVLEEIRPGSFTSPGDFSRMSAIYFSFVTLATLGYGDIVPRTDVARGLAIVEGVGGQLFLAVLVARLVSVYTRGKEAN
jgi:voltage-gated potassium channel Kch